MADYELWLNKDDGTALGVLDTVVSFEYAMAVHQVGACSLVLPGSFDTALLQPDNRIAVWRTPAGGARNLERVYLIRRLLDTTDADGKRTLTVTGLDGNDLLARRIVAYVSGAAQAVMTDQADDMCKAVVTDNLGTDAVAARQLSTYLSVQGDLAAGPSITMAFAWRDVLTTLQDIAEAARQAGTAVYWDVVPLSATTWEFRTATGQPGADHSYPSGVNPVLLGLEYGNLQEPSLERDWSEEVTYVYAGGQGEGAARTIVEVEDTARSGRSVLGRREAFEDARDDTTTAAVTARANSRLSTGRPRLRFSGKIVDSPGTRYGIEWRWGDRLTATYQGQTVEAIVKAVKVSVDDNGKETLDARLEVEE